MTNKSIRDYINLIENAQKEVPLEEYGDTAKGQKMLSKVHHRAADRVTSKQADKDPEYARKAQQTQDRAWERLAVKEEGVESWSGNPSDRRHSGHESYMTPEYMLNHYKKRLAQIQAGKHKYPKEVAQLQAKIAKLEKQGLGEEQLEETSPDAIAEISRLTRRP